MRLRADLADGTVRLELRGGDTAIPWCAAAPVHPPPTAVQAWELPGSRIRSVTVHLADAAPGSAADVTIQVADGRPSTATISAERPEATIRLLPPPQWDGNYRWRIGAGEWRTGRHSHLFVTRAELDDPAAS